MSEVVQHKWTCVHCGIEVKSKKPISFDQCPVCDESQAKTEPKPDPVPERVPAEGPPGLPPPAAPPPGPPAEENKVTDRAGKEAESDKNSKPSPPANSGTPTPNLYPDLSKVEQMEHSSEGGMDRSSSLSPLPQKRSNEESEVEGGQKRRAMSGEVRDLPPPGLDKPQDSPITAQSQNPSGGPPPPGLDKHQGSPIPAQSQNPSGAVTDPPPLPPGLDPQGPPIAVQSHIPGELLEMLLRQARSEGRHDDVEKLQQVYQAMNIGGQAARPPPSEDEQSDEQFYLAQEQIGQHSPKQRTASGVGSQATVQSTTQPNPAGGEEEMVSPCYLRENSTL